MQIVMWHQFCKYNQFSKEGQNYKVKISLIQVNLLFLLF